MDNCWFKTAKMGLIVHFGLYSLLGGEYKNKKMDSYCEWIQSFCRIPNSEYEKLALKFNPKGFNANKLVKQAKQNGFNYLIFTAKHHDGFCLFNSSYDNWNVMHTPYGKDIIKQVKAACDRYNVKFGIYYSQDLDWHEKNGGGYNSKNDDCAGTSWCNNWDFPNNKTKNFNDYFNNKVLFQVNELCKNYGKIDLFWFDTPKTISLAQSKQLFNLVKKYHPNCLINSRIGNGNYDYVTLGDNEIPNEIPSKLENINLNEINGFKYSKNSLYESVCTLNNNWGYSKFDKNFKSITQVKAIKEKLNKLGINYTINIAPNEKGKICKQTLKILKAINK